MRSHVSAVPMYSFTDDVHIIPDPSGDDDAGHRHCNIFLPLVKGSWPFSRICCISLSFLSIDRYAAGRLYFANGRSNELPAKDGTSLGWRLSNAASHRCRLAMRKRPFLRPQSARGLLRSRLRLAFG